MSQSGSNSSGGGGGGIIQTIDGDVGSITGATVTIYADNAANNSGSSVKFVNSGTISTLNLSDSNDNTFLGKISGNLTLTGNQNTAEGVSSLTSLTSGSDNTALGYAALGNSSSDSRNTSVGSLSFAVLDGGSYNTSCGYSAGQLLATGSYNAYYGYVAGAANSGAESSNIYINNIGVTSESNVLRIGAGTGTGGQQLSKAFVSGINGNTVSNAVMVTINTATDQLGVQAIPATGTITWTDEAVSFTAAVNNGYFTSGTITATLPASPTQGQVVAIAVDDTAITTIRANTGQIIRLANTASSTAGTATNTLQGDSMYLVYRSASSTWFSTSTEGNWALA